MKNKNMVIVPILIFIVFFIIGFIWGGSMMTVEAKTFLWKTEEEFHVKKMNEFSDINLANYSIIELESKIEEHQEKKEDAHELAERARDLGWPETSETIEFAKREWTNAQLALVTYQNEYSKREEVILRDKMAEYPEATLAWRYMKSLGWNDYVCAGIIGNMMSETGGQTLALKPSAWGGNFYGLCQWGPGYKEIWDKPIDEQLKFLGDTVKYEFDTYGSKYASNFNYNSFLSLTNEKEAAMAFAKCYERCASFSYEVRKNNATKAYNYFVG